MVWVRHNKDMTNTTKPAATDEAFFVLNKRTGETLAGPTTSRKANNTWKKLVNFGNPIPNHGDFVVTWDRDLVMASAKHQNDIWANGLNASPEALRWASDRARRA